MLRSLLYILLLFRSPSYDLRHVPTLSAQRVDAILAAHHSPAVGLGSYIVKLSWQYGVDDVYLMAFWGLENQFGTDGSTPARYHNPGNMTYSAGCKRAHCWRYYPSWRGGIKAWFELIVGPLYFGSGLYTVDAVAARYAPSSDGNYGYAVSIKRLVRMWRR